MRLLRDLRYFTSSTDHFRFMRTAVSSATHDSRTDATGTPSERGPEPPLPGCIPFLGELLGFHLTLDEGSSLCRDLPVGVV